MEKTWVKLASYRGSFVDAEGTNHTGEQPFPVTLDEKAKAALQCNVLKKLSLDEIPDQEETNSKGDESQS